MSTNVTEPTVQRWRLIGLDLRVSNALEINGRLFVMMPTGEKGFAMLPAQCPHRGGPLHIAQVSFIKREPSLVCPWHGLEIPISSLIRKSLPTIKRGHLATVWVDINPSQQTTIYKRHITVNLSTLQKTNNYQCTNSASQKLFSDGTR